MTLMIKSLLDKRNRPRFSFKQWENTVLIFKSHMKQKWSKKKRRVEIIVKKKNFNFILFLKFYLKIKLNLSYIQIQIEKCLISFI